MFTQITFFFALASFFLFTSPNIKPRMEDHFKSHFIVWNVFSCCFLAETNFGRITRDHRNTTPKATALGGKFLRHHKYPFSSRAASEASALFVPPSRPQPGWRAAPVAATCRSCVSPRSAVRLSPDSQFPFCYTFPSAERVFGPGVSCLLVRRRRRCLVQFSISPMPRTPSDGPLCALWGQKGDEPGPLSAALVRSLPWRVSPWMPALSKFGSTLEVKGDCAAELQGRCVPAGAQRQVSVNINGCSSSAGRGGHPQPPLPARSEKRWVLLRLVYTP